MSTSSKACTLGAESLEEFDSCENSTVVSACIGVRLVIAW